MHAYTYSGHPTCCAVALENIEIMERERLQESAAAMGARLKAGLERGVRRPAEHRRHPRRQGAPRRGGARRGSRDEEELRDRPEGRGHAQDRDDEARRDHADATLRRRRIRRRATSCSSRLRSSITEAEIDRLVDVAREAVAGRGRRVMLAALEHRLPPERGSPTVAFRPAGRNDVAALSRFLQRGFRFAGERGAARRAHLPGSTGTIARTGPGRAASSARHDDEIVAHVAVWPVRLRRAGSHRRRRPPDRLGVGSPLSGRRHLVDAARAGEDPDPDRDRRHGSDAADAAGARIPSVRRALQFRAAAAATRAGADDRRASSGSCRYDCCATPCWRCRRAGRSRADGRRRRSRPTTSPSRVVAAAFAVDSGHGARCGLLPVRRWILPRSATSLYGLQPRRQAGRLLLSSPSRRTSRGSWTCGCQSTDVEDWCAAFRTGGDGGRARERHARGIARGRRRRSAGRGCFAPASAA